MVSADPTGVTRESLALYKKGAFPPLVLDRIMTALEPSAGEPLKWSSMLFVHYIDTEIGSIHRYGRQVSVVLWWGQRI